MDREDASAGGLIGTFLLFLFGGLLFAFEGYVADWLVNLANAQLPGPVSQDSFNCMWFIVTALMATPTLFALYIGLDHIINAFKDQPGDT
jgi:hypothetical protein